MKLVDWHVMLDKNLQHVYLYGPISEHIDTDGMVEVSIDNWSILDMMEVTSNLLENANKHNICNCLYHIVQCLKEANVSECDQREFMKCYMNLCFDNYGSKY